jgi:hypothetical protein
MKLEELHKMFTVGAVLEHKTGKVKQPKQKKWMSASPVRCDICKCALDEHETFIDGVTVYGPWAIMCPPCHKEKGHGVGLGKGQEYDRATGTKVAG